MKGGGVIMKCLDRFNEKMNRGGGSLRSENVNNSNMLLRETFYDDASLTQGIYIWELGLLGLDSYIDKEPIKIRLYKRSFSNANGYTVKFQTLYDTPIIVGDTIYDSKKDEYYICTESFDIDGIHWQGKFTLCNWILKWQDKNGKILEYPCIDINSTQYNSGELSNRQFTVGSSQHMITLPCDENTVVLNSPRRFFLDKNKENPTSFIVTQNDTTSYSIGKKGLVKVTLFEYANDAKADRPDLGICDYIDVESIKTDNSDDILVSKSVISFESKVIKSGGDSQLFIGKFYDNDGNEILNIVPKWTIICDFLNALEVEESGNEIWIGLDDERYIDEEVRLVLSDENGNYSSALVITIDSLL